MKKYIRQDLINAQYTFYVTLHDKKLINMFSPVLINFTQSLYILSASKNTHDVYDCITRKQISKMCYVEDKQCSAYVYHCLKHIYSLDFMDEYTLYMEDLEDTYADVN